MSVTDLPPLVTSIASHLRRILDKCRTIKTSTTIEPHLTTTDLNNDLEQLAQSDASNGTRGSNQPITTNPLPPAFETAARAVLYETLATHAIHEPGFVDVWNLLDVIQACADRGTCEAGLALWLVEELLDSQTIEGCRSIFDYLESRREHLIGNSLSLNKRNTLLRTCNELLHRLSRAEDAVFCGRIFIFLFQIFPLGDKSAVNLRGEYHTENTTTYDETETDQDVRGGEAAKEENMDVDVDMKSNVEAQDAALETPASEKVGESLVNNEGADLTKAPNIPTATASVETSQTTSDTSKTLDEDPLSAEKLYPMFWSLQKFFSNPPKIFEAEEFATFKKGLEIALEKFKSVTTVTQMTGSSPQGTKRKRGDDGDDLLSTFNPKYLTSRELFKLELSDLTFQRHILVQALIMIDFLLSLTPKAKKKHAQLKPQKAMLCAYTLSEPDTQWATSSKSSIMAYLAVPTDGKFYNRMVENVLSRDKNWLRWKMESCPPIQRPPLLTADHVKAQTEAKRMCTNRRLKATPMGAIRLDFLSELEKADKLALLRNDKRSDLPTSKTLLSEAKGIDLDLEMADKTDRPIEWLQLVDKRASKTWRALRLVSKTRVGLFAEVDESKNLDALDAEKVPQMDGANDTDVMVEEQERISDGKEEEKGEQKLEVDAIKTDIPIEANETTDTGEAISNGTAAAAG